MPTIFTRIIDGEIPSRMVWEDDRCVAFLDVRPLAPGHCLVVPRVEVDHWTDLDPEVAAHLTTVAQVVGRAQRQVFRPARVGLLVAGFEVPHVHLHVIPAQTMADFDFARADTSPDGAALDANLDALRQALLDAGHTEVSSRQP
jgi:histidine triad (HIT) family protein